MADKRLKYARVEIERRFLLANLPAEIDPLQGYRRIEDHYFSGTSLRLRRVTAPRGDIVELKLNQKLPHEPAIPSHRIITSVYLGPADYRLLAQLGGAKLVKRRYTLSWQRIHFCVDVFENALAGLVLAEAAVDSESALESVPAIPVRHVEVTGDSSFAGGSLAVGDPSAVLRHAEQLLIGPAS